MRFPWVSPYVCSCYWIALSVVALLWAMEALKVEDVARLLHVNKKWVYAHVAELGGFRIGDRMLRFSRERVEDYLAKQAQGPAPQPVIEPPASPREYRVSV